MKSLQPIPYEKDLAMGYALELREAASLNEAGPSDIGVVPNGETLRRISVLRHRPCKFVSLAPKEEMATGELIDYYLPGSPEDQALCLISSAAELERTIQGHPISDMQSRVMSLLVKSKNLTTLNNSELWERANYAISCALGSYLKASRDILSPIAYRFHSPEGSLGVDDLFMYGQIGLMSALERFDLGQGYQFWTYASSRVKGEIIDNQRAFGSVISIPRSALDLSKQHRQALAEDPDYLQKLSPEERDHIRSELDSFSLMKPKSLDAPSDVDKKINLGDTVSDHEATDEEAAMENQETVNQILTMVDALPRKLSQVVKMYYGLDGYEAMTLAEIGQALGVTESRSSQLHTKALSFLKTSFTDNKDKQLL